MLAGSFRGSTSTTGAGAGAGAGASTTGAGAGAASGSFGFSLAQATSKFASTILIKSFFMVFLLYSSKLKMWPPHRFAGIAALREHMLLHTAIAGHGRQYTT